MNQKLIPFGPCLTIEPEAQPEDNPDARCCCPAYYARTGTHADDCPKHVTPRESMRLVCGDHDHAISAGYVIRVADMGADEETSEFMRKLTGADQIAPGMKVYYRSDHYAQIGDVRVIGLQYIVGFEK